MPDTDHIDENEVLRRMLATPHSPHKPLGRKQPANQRDGKRMQDKRD